MAIDELPPNVTPISKGKKKEKSSTEAEKIPEGKILISIADAINKEPRPELPLPAFPVDFLLIETAPGVSEAVRPAFDGVLTPASEAEVVSAIMSYCHNDLINQPDYAFTHRRAVECMKTWKAFTPAMPPPPAVRFLSEPGYCWQRLPFDLEPGGATATWDGLLSGIESDAQRTAIKAWIGSLFVPESYRQQYVWIWGGGGNGKGCLTRFLHRVMGRVAHFVSIIPKEPNQFWTRQFVNKRLVAVPDCDNYHFPKSGLFKTLTGDDPIQMEIKGGASYTAKLDAKFIFTGQEFPNLGSKQSDLRRIIFARLETTPDWRHGFEDDLWSEGGAFLADCLETYKSQCPNDGPIPVDNEDMDDWVATLETPMDEFFDERFELNEASFILKADMNGVLKYYANNRGPQLEFLKWLDRKHGVRYGRKRWKKNEPGNGERVRAFWGIKMIKPLYVPVSHKDHNADR